MKILDVVNPVNLEGIKRIKCDILLKSSWNHSKFAGVVVNEDYVEGCEPKLMTVEQMKFMCNGHQDIEFVNVKNPNDVIFKFVNNRIGFLINMNSDTTVKVISAETKELNPISLSPNIKIEQEYSKGFRVSEDNKVMTIDTFSDYELIKGLFNLVAEATNMGDTYTTNNFREKASQLLKDINSDCKPMGVF